MFSKSNRTRRFSLSAIASTLKGNRNNSSSAKTYNKQEVDDTIAEIKSIGKQRREQAANTSAAQSTNRVVFDIRQVLKLMKNFEYNLHIQRVACHVLSNLAMDMITARYIVTNFGFDHIQTAMTRFPTDHKLCWLASSALWNMARPPANRELIGTKGAKLMLQTLENHFRTSEKVSNTAIGALSNLSLCEGVKGFISESQNIALILKVLNHFSNEQNTTKSISVMTSGAGLLANLAVSDEHAATLLSNDTLPILLRLLTWQKQNPANDEEMENDNEAEVQMTMEDTLHRNSCAALNNMVSADNFLDSFLNCNGTEIVYTFMKHTKNQLFIDLLSNCLPNCDIDKPITTLHLCAMHNKLNLLKKIIEQASTIDHDTDIDIDRMDIDDVQDELAQSECSSKGSSSSSAASTISVGCHIWGEQAAADMDVKTLLNQVDASNMTCLQYAALGKHYDLIEFLVKCGADAASIADSQEQADNEATQCIKDAVQRGKKTIESISAHHGEALCEVLSDFPTDLCNYMVSFNNEIDMLSVANAF